MALNLGGLAKRDEDDADAMNDVPLPKEDEARKAEEAPAARKAEADEYASLVSDITPSAPPRVDDEPRLRRAESVLNTDKDGEKDRSSGTKGAAEDEEEVRDEQPKEDLTSDRKADLERSLAASMSPDFANELNQLAGSANGKSSNMQAHVQPAESRAPANAIDTIIGLTAAPLVGAAVGVSKGVQKFQEILSRRRQTHMEEFSAGTVRARMLAAKKEQLLNSVTSMYDAGDDLRKDVEAFNLAFLKSGAASKIRDKARKEGRTIEEVLGDLSNGKGDPELLAAARDVMKDPLVADAWDKVNQRVSEIDMKQKSVQSSIEHLSKNYGDEFDARKEAEALAKNAKLVENVPSPVFEDPEGEKKLKERLKELAERMIKWAQEFIEKLVNALRAVAALR